MNRDPGFWRDLKMYKDANKLSKTLHNREKEKAAKVINMQLPQLSSPLRLPSPNLSQS